MRVLIADDNTIVRVDLRAILGELGHAVCAEARDGFEAVELAGEVLPELAMLDVRMPRLETRSRTASPDGMRRHRRR